MHGHGHRRYGFGGHHHGRRGHHRGGHGGCGCLPLIIGVIVSLFTLRRRGR